jgi:hypothetical protein
VVSSRMKFSGHPLRALRYLGSSSAVNVFGALFTAEGAEVFAEERREKLKYSVRGSQRESKSESQLHP